MIKRNITKAFTQPTIYSTECSSSSSSRCGNSNKNVSMEFDKKFMKVSNYTSIWPDSIGILSTMASATSTVKTLAAMFPLRAVNEVRNFQPTYTTTSFYLYYQKIIFIVSYCVSILATSGTDTLSIFNTCHLNVIVNSWYMNFNISTICICPKYIPLLYVRWLPLQEAFPTKNKEKNIIQEKTII